MMKTEGISVEMPEELKCILDSEQWLANSYASQSGRLCLVLSCKYDKKIELILKIELSNEGKIASYRELKNYELPEESSHSKPKGI